MAAHFHRWGGAGVSVVEMRRAATRDRGLTQPGDPAHEPPAALPLLAGCAPMWAWPLELLGEVARLDSARASGVPAACSATRVNLQLLCSQKL